ncbi:MAG TPA: 2Fe-2S iron-sulfur cluster binding domain-containing protein [Bacteroidetes bacterium]|nr:2Fe-2S iron-sulfur cluster binding domain-containing protein [Bacteroidota bacterium]
MIHFILNDQTIQAGVASGTTVLDFVRYHRHLTGTKIGCREGDCGACTVLVGEPTGSGLQYRAMTSCLLPLANAQGRHIVTIEGLNRDEGLTPVQQAIVEEGGTQCGFCTPGFVVSLTGFLLRPGTASAIATIDGNICRCTGYKSIERAAAKTSAALKAAGTLKNADDRLRWLVENNFLPPYFLKIKKQLEALPRDKPEANNGNTKAILIGGGTDLYVQKPEEMAGAPIRSIFHQKELKKIYRQDDHCYIGAANTATDLLESPLMQSIFPQLNRYVQLISSTPIRNMGTLGGNLVNASPIGDLIIFFLALDSHIVLNKNGKKRTIKLRHFYKGYKKLDMRPGEYVESLFFKIPRKEDYYYFEKISKRTHLDIASVNMACLLKMEKGRIGEAHISAGGVGPVPMYLEKSCAALSGKKISASLLKQTARTMQKEVAPISDARGTAAYKRLLLQRLFYGCFLEMEGSGVKIKDLIAG